MPEIKGLREQINRVDREIVRLLEERVEVVKEIGRIKRERGFGVSDPNRESEVLDKVSSSTKLDRKFVRGLFRSIIEYCKNEQS